LGSTLDKHSYDTLPNLFPKPWYWGQPRKTLKRETVLNLNLVKNYQVLEAKMQPNNVF